MKITGGKLDDLMAKVWRERTLKPDAPRVKRGPREGPRRRYGRAATSRPKHVVKLENRRRNKAARRARKRNRA